MDERIIPIRDHRVLYNTKSSWNMWCYMTAFIINYNMSDWPVKFWSVAPLMLNVNEVFQEDQENPIWLPAFTFQDPLSDCKVRKQYCPFTHPDRLANMHSDGNNVWSWRDTYYIPDTLISYIRGLKQTTHGLLAACQALSCGPQNNQHFYFNKERIWDEQEGIVNHKI